MGHTESLPMLWRVVFFTLLCCLQQVRLCQADSIKLLALETEEDRDDSKAVLELACQRINSYGVLCGGNGTECDVSLELEWIAPREQYQDTVDDFGDRFGRGGFAGFLTGDIASPMVRTALSYSEVFHVPALSFAPKLPHTKEYGYFYRSAVSYLDVPSVILLTLGHLNIPEAALVATPDAILSNDDFIAAERTLAGRGAMIPAITMRPLVRSREAGAPCATSVFSEMMLVREMRLKVVIADVDDEAMLRCLFCAGHVTEHVNGNHGCSEEFLVWVTIGNFRDSWWETPDSALAASRIYSPGDPHSWYGNGELVGDRCEAQHLALVANFHVNVAPQQVSDSPNNSWLCGSTQLGTTGDVWSAAGEYAVFSGVAADALCVASLVFGSILENYTADELNLGSQDVFDAFEASAHNADVVNFYGASAQVVRFDGPGNYPRAASKVLVHQLQHDVMVQVASWWHYGAGVLMPTSPEMELMFPGHWYLCEGEETADDGDVVNTEVMVILVSASAALLLAVGICIAMTAYSSRAYSWNTRSRDREVMEEANFFLTDLQGQARTHHMEEQIWRSLALALWNTDVQAAVHVFVYVDEWCFNSLHSTPDPGKANSELERVIRPALLDLCRQEHLHPGSVRFCIAHSGRICGSDNHQTPANAAGRTLTIKHHGLGVAGYYESGSFWGRCCQCERRRQQNTVLRKALLKDSFGLNHFRQIAFAIDQADYFLLFKEDLDMPNPATKSHSRLITDGEVIDDLLDCGEEQDAGRAFACLCALALKPPDSHFNFDGEYVLRSVTQGDLESLVSVDAASTSGFPAQHVRHCLKALSSIERARTALLQLWSAAISHGNPEFVICLERYAEMQDYGSDVFLPTDKIMTYPGRSLSSALRKRLELSDLPVYLPTVPASSTPSWATQTPDFSPSSSDDAKEDFRMSLQEVHGSHDRAALHSHRKAVLQLIRALRQNFQLQLDCTDCGFVAPSKHKRALVLVESLKYFDKQMQNNVLLPRKPRNRRGETAIEFDMTAVSAGVVHVPHHVNEEVQEDCGPVTAMGSPLRTFMDTSPALVEEAEFDIVLGYKDTLEYCNGRFNFAEIGKDSRMLRDTPSELNTPQQASPGGTGTQFFKMQHALRRSLRSTVKKMKPGSPGSGLCKPGNYQCKGCLAARRRREAEFAVCSLEPQVQEYLLFFIRTVEANFQLQDLALAKIEDELQNGYRAVYMSVLGLIREEEEYESLVYKVDEVLHYTADLASKLTNPATLVNLVSAAHVHHRRLQIFCRDLARSVCEVDGKETHVTELETRGGLDLEKVPPPKGCWRILEKNALQRGFYRRRQSVFAGPISTQRCFDAARSTIICRDCKGMLKVVDLLCGERSPVIICRGKNRFRKPSEGGWADVLFNVVWKDDPSRHVMEIQLVHVKLMMIRHSSAFKGHDRYGEFRAAMEVSEVLDLDIPTFLPIPHR